MADENFIMAHKSVFYCVGVISPEGELVPLTVFDKIVYFHMLDRKRLFTDNGSKHFEGQDTIAELLHLNRKTVITSLKKLLEAGVIFGHKETHASRGFKHWVYTGVAYPLNTYGDKRSVKQSPSQEQQDEIDSPF